MSPIYFIDLLTVVFLQLLRFREMSSPVSLVGFTDPADSTFSGPSGNRRAQSSVSDAYIDCVHRALLTAQWYSRTAPTGSGSACQSIG